MVMAVCYHHFPTYIELSEYVLGHFVIMIIMIIIIMIIIMIILPTLNSLRMY